MSSTMPVESSINNSSNNSNKPSACIDIKNHSNLEVSLTPTPPKLHPNFNPTSTQLHPEFTRVHLKQTNSGKTPWNSAEVKRFGVWRR